MAKTENLNPPMSTTSETPAPESDQGMRYEVVKGDFGPYTNGAVFSEAAFKKVHAINPQIKDVDRDAYHDGLLQRGIQLGVIVPSQKPLSAIEPGPLNPMATDIMSSIRKSHEEVAKNQSDRKAVQEADVAQQTKTEPK